MITAYDTVGKFSEVVEILHVPVHLRGSRKYAFF